MRPDAAPPQGPAQGLAQGQALGPAGHPATEAAFRAALNVDDVPPGLTAPDPAEVPRRFAVYRNNVAVGRARALAARFPAVERLVGPAFMAAAARAFAAAHPPQGPVLHDWGGAFPGWLAGFAPVAHLPWLGDVARIEDLRARAVHAADAPCADPAGLAVADPGAVRLRLAPSVAAYASDHPAVAIWAAQQPGAPSGSPGAGPSFALIGRGRDFAVLTLPLTAADHAFLSALMSGARLGPASEQGDPAPVLTALLTHGLIAAIDPE